MYIISSLKYKILQFFSVQIKDPDVAKKLAGNSLMVKAFCIAVGKDLNLSDNKPVPESLLPIIPIYKIESYVNDRQCNIFELANVDADYSKESTTDKYDENIKDSSNIIRRFLPGFSLTECAESFMNNYDRRKTATELMGINMHLEVKESLISDSDKATQQQHKSLVNDIVKITKKQPYFVRNILESNNWNKEQTIAFINNYNGKIEEELYLVSENPHYKYTDKSKWLCSILNTPLLQKEKYISIEMSNLGYEVLPKDGVKKGTLVLNKSSNMIGVVVKDTNYNQPVLVMYYNPFTGFEWSEICFYYSLEYNPILNNKNVLIARSIGFINQLQKCSALQLLMNVMKDERYYNSLKKKFKNLSKTIYDVFSLVKVRSFSDRMKSMDIKDFNFLHSLMNCSKNPDNNNDNELYNVFIEQAIRHINSGYYLENNSEMSRETIHPYKPNYTYQEKVYIIYSY